MHQEIDMMDEATNYGHDEATGDAEAAGVGHGEEPMEVVSAVDPLDIVLEVLTVLAEKLEQRPESQGDEIPADVPRFVRS